MDRHYSQSSFTLAELLIVLAIVAILVIAAIPRHAASQVHTKVVRVQVDFRHIKNALESYHVDYETYPPATTGATDYTPIFFVIRYRPLTSPVAYLSTPQADPFGNAFAPDRPAPPIAGGMGTSGPSGTPITQRGFTNTGPGTTPAAEANSSHPIICSPRPIAHSLSIT